MSLKIPPVVVFFVCLATMFGIYYITPDFSFSIPFRVTISRVFLALGALAALLGIVAFRNQSTTVDPTKPDKASSLVTGGVYQYTRNPMYLGMALVLLGGVVRTGNPLCLLSIMLFVWYLTNFQIKPEEKALIEIFGKEYQAYLKKVRRWI